MASSVRKALRLLPPCASTGIGSLPHTQQELAIQLALQVDVPYLPQLPSQNPAELMIPAALDGLPGLSCDADGACTVDVRAWEAERESFGVAIEAALQSDDLTSFEPSAQACRSWRPFLWEVENRKLPFAKVQLAGPSTVRWVARTKDGSPASDVPALDQQLHRLMVAKALALAKAVRRAGSTPIVFLDEPGLYALDRREPRHVVALQELRFLIMALEREGALVGVHCCGNTDWASLLALDMDILAIDVRLSLDALLEDRAAFLKFLEQGSTLCLGLVPTDLSSAYRLEELVDSVEAALRSTLPPRLPFEATLSQMLLSPACGLAMRSVIDAERVFDELRSAQRQLRGRVSGEVVSRPPSAMA